MAILRFQYAPVDMTSADLSTQLLELLSLADSPVSADNGSSALVLHLSDGSTLTAFGSFSYDLNGEPVLSSTITGVGLTRPSGIALTITGLPVATLDYIQSFPGSYVETLNGQSKNILGSALGDTLVGAAAADTIAGADGNDSLDGNVGNDSISGGAGDDSLSGSVGDDTLVGGTGNDAYWVTGFDVVKETAGAGIDTVYTGQFGYILGANIERLVLTAPGLTGTGNAAANQITGTSGVDTLNGRGGADKMMGGAGDDFYFVDDAGDQVVDSSGNDTVRSSIDYVLGSPIENLVLGGTALHGDGSDKSNSLVGNGEDNTLRGFGGADTLNGADGADQLEGGPGADLYLVTAADHVVELAGEGSDTIQIGANYTLPKNFEALTLTGSGNFRGTGNGAANVITGNAGNNLLDGKGGADHLFGGAGDDTFILDNAGDVVSDSSGLHDLIKASFDFNLGATPEIENLTLTGDGDIDGTGNNLANLITGTSGANVLAAAGVAGLDTLLGGAGNDTLTGTVGQETLDGGAGVDSMSGGNGDDVYYVDDALDQVIEGADNTISGAHDWIYSSVSFTLPSETEWLTLLGSDSINGTGTSVGGNMIFGNDAANVLTGGGGNNDELHGNGGNDTLGSASDGIEQMYGGTGDDLFRVYSISSTVSEDTNEGTDTVEAHISYDLSVKDANVENLVLAEGQVGYGNSLDNVITGNDGNNFLDGKGGVDKLGGGGGDDVLTADSFDFTGVGVRVDGGTGTDEIRLASGSDLDLTGIDNSKLASIERFDLRTDGDHTLTLDSSDVNSLAADHTVYVRADAGDEVVASGAWVQGDNVVVDEIDYYQYTLDGATLRVAGIEATIVA